MRVRKGTGGAWAVGAVCLVAATLTSPAVSASLDAGADPCGGLEAIVLPSGQVTCTHGDDPRDGLS